MVMGLPNPPRRALGGPVGQRDGKNNNKNTPWNLTGTVESRVLCRFNGVWVERELKFGATAFKAHWCKSLHKIP